MNWQINFWISLVVNIVLVILLFFKGGINSIIVDNIRRKRDKKEREQKSLKCLKNMLDRLSRQSSSVRLKIAQGGLSFEEEFKDYINKFNEVKNEFDEELINCPENIELEVNKFFKIVDIKTMAIIREVESGVMLPTEFIKLYLVTIDGVIDRTKNAIARELNK